MLIESRKIGNDLLVLRWKNGATEIRRFSTRGVIVIEADHVIEFIATFMDMNGLFAEIQHDPKIQDKENENADGS